MKKFIVLLFEKITGWEVVGSLPENVDKAILIAAPHTSNYDFLQGLMVFWKCDLNVKFLIKQFWMKPPWKWFMKPLGGIGVNRSSKNKTEFVDSLKRLFSEIEEPFQLMITPEGTRSWVPRWKTGFYRIAVDVNVPIILCYTDKKTKTCGLGEVFYPTGDFEKDMEYIQAFYANFTGRHPEKYNPKIY
jgi:1-acyl-sn-glycerol-3-phosphate acyltransferase